MTKKIEENLDPCTAYAQDVVDGRIVAGPHVRAACQRHLDDLEHGPERGLSWHPVEVDRVIGFFREVLTVEREVYDEFLEETISEVVPFKVEPSQAFILGSLFGWKNKHGHRRFRRCYIEIGKGNGKSPMAAGIGHYMMLATKKLRAEIYSAATDKDQAAILFRDAVEMWRRSPHLHHRLTSSGQNPVWQLTYHSTSSFFKPISSEKKGKSGIRPYCALIDEVHEHPNNEVIEMLRAGTKGNQQALIFEITNSGMDLDSTCGREHEYSIKIANGELKNDAWFAFVCSMDNERVVELYSGMSALRRITTCVSITPEGKFIARDSALPATSASDDSKTSKPASSVKTIPVEPLLREAVVTVVTRDGASETTPSTPSSDGDTSATTPRLTTSGDSKPTSETGDTGSGKSATTQHGSATGQGRSSDSAGSSLPSLSDFMTADAGSAAVPTRAELYEWITATIQALYADCSVTSAMLESVCSEMARLSFDALSNMSLLHPQLTWDGESLKEAIGPDDPFEDESCWEKANPLMGVAIFPEFVREQVQEAKGMPSKESMVRRLHFCQWTEGGEEWITRKAWKAIERPLKLEDYAGMRCWGGLDLSYTTDLSALALVFEPESQRYHCFVRFWKPKEGLSAAIRRDRQPYDLWVQNGHLHLTEGRVIKLAPIAQYLAECYDRFDLQCYVYDAYRHRELQDDMLDLGVELPMQEHPQGFRRAKDIQLWMPKSVQDLENAITEDRIRVQENPLLRWNAASTVVREDPAGTDNKIFDKRKSRARIDGIVALAMGVGAATVRQKPVFPMSLEQIVVDL